MVAFKARFDGKVLIPDEPVDLPRGQSLTVRIEAPAPASGESPQMSALKWLADHSVDDPSLPEDLSDNLDHYLYGLPKKKP
jgi:hypothetical protein